MPRVPSLPQVEASPLQVTPLQRDKSNAAEVLGYAGHAAQIGLQAKEQADTYRAEDAFNRLQEQKIQLWGDASQKQGANALNVHDEYTSAYDEKVNEIADGLGSGAADKFRQAAARGRLAFSAELEHHQIRQADVTMRETAFAGVKTMIDSAKTTPIRDAAVMYANRAGFLAEQEADRQGLTGDARDILVKEWRGKVLGAHIEELLKVNPAEADSFYKAHAGQFTGNDDAAIKKRIQDNMAANEVQIQAVKISSMPEADRLAEVDRVSEGKPDFRVALRSEVLHRASAQKTMEAAGREEAIGRLMDMRFPTVPGQKAVAPAAIMRSQDWLNTSPQDRRRLLESWDAEEKERASGMKDPALELARYAAYLDVKDHSVGLRDMTDAQILGRYAPVLGSDLTKKLLDEKRNIEKEGAPKVDADSFKTIARDNGLKVDSKSTTDKAQLGKLMDRAEQAVILEEHQTGKPLTRDRKAEIIKALTRKVKLEEYGRWWNSTTEKRLFEVSAPEVDASIVADPDKFQSILDDLEAAGLAPTGERIRNAYLLKYSEVK